LASLERAASLAKTDGNIAIELASVRHEAGIEAFKKGDYASAGRLFAAAEAGGAGRGSKLLLAGAQANAGDLELSEKQCRNLLVYMKQSEDAAREFLIAHDMEPEKAGPLLAAAAALMTSRNYEGARKVLVERLPRVSEPGFARLALGEVLLYEDRTDESAET